jgi:hypothetical protein
MSLLIMMNWVVLGLLFMCIYKGLKIIKAQEQSK